MGSETSIRTEQVKIAALKADLGNFDQCVRDARRAALDSEVGPPDPVSYDDLRGRLLAAENKIPPIYRESVCEPFTKKLELLGRGGFDQILSRDKTREREAALLFDIAQAILQKGDGYLDKATAAFQEVVSDLYDGFLSVQYRKGIRRAERQVVPPLVKWGMPEMGPYTWTTGATVAFGVKAGIVSLPPAHARLGLLAWTGLAHEAAGHDILSANGGLIEELSEAVGGLSEDPQKSNPGPIPPRLAEYWSSRIDEAAADVLGILNMGPAAALGLIGYLRAMSWAYGEGNQLRRCDAEHDSHPMDLMRAYLAAATVRLLRFEARETWASVLEEQVDRDFWPIDLDGYRLSRDAAKASAAAVAGVIVNGKLDALNRHALSEIQTWRNRDEAIVSELEQHLTTLGPLHDVYSRGYYAAHVVAAAVRAALKEGADIPLIFDRMLGILRLMYDENPSWGPLAIASPSDLAPLRIYVPTGAQGRAREPQRVPFERAAQPPEPPVARDEDLVGYD